MPEANTTLVINDAQGNWVCDDDGGTNNLNPAINFANPGCWPVRCLAGRHFHERRSAEFYAARFGVCKVNKVPPVISRARRARPASHHVPMFGMRSPTALLASVRRPLAAGLPIELAVRNQLTKAMAPVARLAFDRNAALP